MKNTTKTALCGIIAALMTVFMLLSYFPYLTYAIPAFAGLFVVIVVIEINLKWAVGTYFAAAVPVMIFAETESKMMFVCFFGYYPILKAALERIHKPVLEWALKFAAFNAAVLAVYWGLAFLFDLSFADFGEFGRYGAYILLAVGNVVFLLYDIAVSRMAAFYVVRLHKRIQSMLK